MLLCVFAFYNKSFDEIERKIGVKSSTSKKIWQQVYETTDSKDFHEIIACIGRKKVHRRPTKVIDSTSKS